jgi:lysophospholipase L1-like esterase
LRNFADYHFGKSHAGQCLEWLPPDTQENFQRLMQDPKHQSYFSSLGWDQPRAITYQLNSEGFRCEEFDTESDCVVALGCSFTIGIGLPIDTVWSSLLGKKLNLKVYNLAWGGSSADTCYRLARHWVPKLKPKLIAMLTPPRDRIELIMGNTTFPVEVFMPMSKSKFFNENDMFFKHWWLNDENGQINSEKNLLAIQQLAANHNAKFVSLNVDEEMTRSREEVGYARDYMHAGPRGHELVAEKMLGILQWP